MKAITLCLVLTSAVLETVICLIAKECGKEKERKKEEIERKEGKDRGRQEEGKA